VPDSRGSQQLDIVASGSSITRLRYDAADGMRRSLPLLIGLTIAVSAAAAAASRTFTQLAERGFSGSTDHPAIEYAQRPTTDAVSRLVRQIAGGTMQPAFDASSGYLRSVLQALDLPVESQILVFSRTGIQSGSTGPRNPRALYFNDSVVVGFLRGAPFLELASHDPQQGVIFSTLPQNAGSVATPTRRDRCVSCHQSLASLDVPGMLVRSHFVSPNGVPLRQLGDVVVDHRTPFAQRWGGWYVTGTHGAMRHLGNATIVDAEKPEAAITTDTLNRRSLAQAFDSAGYPSAHSDIVALMVFEHQMHAINLITRVGWEVRVARHENRLDLTTGPAADAIAELVDYFLFVDEAPLTAPVDGASGFAATFSRGGRRDRKGRSLRDLDLQTRLLRVPCSYMIDTAAFDGLPSEARDAIYRRMWTILSEPADGRYRRLSAADRRAVVEILRDTRKDLPTYFQ
jgi:hypothetical protein